MRSDNAVGYIHCSCRLACMCICVLGLRDETRKMRQVIKRSGHVFGDLSRKGKGDVIVWGWWLCNR